MAASSNIQLGALSNAGGMVISGELYKATNGCIDALEACDDYEVEYLKQELCMDDINRVYTWLGIVGSFDNISPLHHQKILQREILPTNASRLHLVWYGGTIYIKPLPLCLINAAYFHSKVHHNREVFALAAGFLRSYCFLIQSRVDFEIAKKHYLIPEDLDWTRWHNLRTDVVHRLPIGRVGSKRTTETLDPWIKNGDLNKRWRYGELRLARLNWIYQLTFIRPTYFTHHREYSTYFQDYFGTFIIMFAFLTTLLSAMQVIVSIESTSSELVAFSFRFSAAALIIVAFCSASITGMFIVLFMYNAIWALAMQLRHRKDINHDMGNVANP